jgi:hypothetical protein
MIAVIAEREGEIVGVVEHRPTHRSCGVWESTWHRSTRGEESLALTSAVSEAVLDEGKLPCYGTSASNIPSMRTALAVGFKPTWVEVLSRPSDR